MRTKDTVIYKLRDGREYAADDLIMKDGKQYRIIWILKDEVSLWRLYRDPEGNLRRETVVIPMEELADFTPDEMPETLLWEWGNMYATESYTVIQDQICRTLQMFKLDSGLKKVGGVKLNKFYNSREEAEKDYDFEIEFKRAVGNWPKNAIDLSKTEERRDAHRNR